AVVVVVDEVTTVVEEEEDVVEVETVVDVVVNGIGDVVLVVVVVVVQTGSVWRHWRTRRFRWHFALTFPCRLKQAGARLAVQRATQTGRGSNASASKSGVMTNCRR